MRTLTRILRRGVVAAVAVTVAVAGPIAVPAGADGPPTAGPYGQQQLQEGVSSFVCVDSDGSTRYDGPAWTLEPLVRGPAFAPVVLFLTSAGNAPVMPLDFTVSGEPIDWRYERGGALAGTIFGVSGRPVAYGGPPTDAAPRVTCTMTFSGFYDFGGYRMTRSLVRMIGLPASVLGRTIYFDNEAFVRFTVPEYLFPLTTGTVNWTLPVPDLASYPRVALPTVTIRHAGTVAYRGPAYTLAPLTRGIGWAPMAFWLAGDRIVTPQWFRSTLTGTWQTNDGGAYRHGTVNIAVAHRPRGYGARPQDATGGYDSSWSGTYRATVTVTPAIATQLGLPSGLLGRRVGVDVRYGLHAYAPNWLFPPA